MKPARTKNWAKKYIFCSWVTLLVYVTSNRRSQVGSNLDGAWWWTWEGDARAEEDMCHSGEGWSPYARKPAPGRRSDREILWLPTPRCPANPVVNHWSNTWASGTTSREKVGKAPTRAWHEALELFKAWKIPRTAHETAAVWDWSFISYSKESTEYPTYVENYTGHLPYLVQSCIEVARGQDTFILHR